MGAEQSRVDLHDHETSSHIPTYITRVTSNFILALYNGIFYACIIIRPATVIKDGYTVYFFHFKGEAEVPSNCIIGNLWCLMNCEITYTDANGKKCTGRIIGTDQNNVDSNYDQPMNFFVYNCNQCEWVSFPYIFMTREQARLLCG
ncbi:unnamed protein product [Psylliodes chrysocephalus]|uniref:Uncharacterized protein n=1 Tax=Psylliodes chrysocephalus TaxID=3402493 RepID=A0A9P0CLX5_9CUCU|nr:unnamed protein product [Psylliodes chrysocephala]